MDRRIEVLLALAICIAGGLWSAKMYIEMKYELKLDAERAHIQLQIDALQADAKHHPLSRADANQLRLLKHNRAEIGGLE